MVEALARLPDLTPVSQPEAGVTYAAKISKAETRIDWARPAREIIRHVQGLAPFPGAWFEQDGERIKLLAAALADGSSAPGTAIDDHLTIACGNGAIRPSMLQRAGHKALSLDEFLRGFAIPAGTRLA